MGTEYSVFVTLPGDGPIPIGSVSGWEHLQRTLSYYAKLSSGEVFAVADWTQQVIVVGNPTDVEFPSECVTAAGPTQHL
jgi:hypothetical protein